MSFNSITKTLLTGIASAVILLMPSCVTSENEEETLSLDQGPYLEDIADDYIIPAYSRFLESSISLQKEVNSFTEQPSSSTYTSLPETLMDAYYEWEAIGFLDFGPAFTHTLRANINTFPTDNFAIEIAIESGEIDLDKISSYNKKGLPAMDYLINGAAAEEVIGNFTTDPFAENRKKYLLALAQDIVDRSNLVSQAWSFDGGNFRGTFIGNKGTAVGSSFGLMVNSLSQYLESFTRDARIGIPLGKRSQGVPIPKSVEGYYSQNSIALASSHINGLKRYYLLGTSSNHGMGLYDYVKSTKASYGEELLADAILNQFDEALTKVEAIKLPLEQAITEEYDLVNEAHTALQKLVVMTKVEMSSALGILISYQDNDGD